MDGLGGARYAAAMGVSSSESDSTCSSGGIGR